jgi:hypothetical protein
MRVARRTSRPTHGLYAARNFEGNASISEHSSLPPATDMPVETKKAGVKPAFP